MKQTTQTYLSLPETFHPASTAPGKHPDSSMPRCYSDGRPYYSLNAWLKDQFGQKIYKLALDGGMTCPNRDGTLGTSGPNIAPLSSHRCALSTIRCSSSFSFK